MMSFKRQTFAPTLCDRIMTSNYYNLKESTSNKNNEENECETQSNTTKDKRKPVIILTGCHSYELAKMLVNRAECIIASHPSACITDNDVKVFMKYFDEYFDDSGSMDTHVCVLKAFNKAKELIETQFYFGRIDINEENESFRMSNKYDYATKQLNNDDNKYQYIYQENHGIIVHNITQMNAQKLKEYIELKKHDEMKGNNDEYQLIKGTTFIKNAEFPELSSCIFTFYTNKAKDTAKNIIQEKISVEEQRMSDDFPDKILATNQNFAYYVYDLPEPGFPLHPYKSHNKWLYMFNGQIINRNIKSKSSLNDSMYNNSNSTIGNQVYMNILQNELQCFNPYYLCVPNDYKTTADSNE
mmetsp:Transcript_13514/g.16675  ORF Transcript_13514/g.16675 Transcript_13514/m.16675 type:complete len:356 (+) Transcript_13514:42-1109(+)